MALDINLFYFFNNLARQSHIVDAIVIFFAAYVQYILISIFFILLYVWSYTKKKKIQIFQVTLLSVVIARLGITECIRFFYHRPRPFSVLPVHQLLSEHEWSFPSGHSALFFALAMAVYCYHKKWGSAFFIAALLMNISRIIAGVHYPSDIIGGMGVGLIVGYLMYYAISRVGLKNQV